MLNYLVLPSLQTAFEIDHLRRMNRVALAFFWANLPLFVTVAWLNETGPLLAVALSALVLAGPSIAVAMLDNQRFVSIIHGITAMCMGGLLVHFGQGPLQIEMHFYFFSLLAVLAVFGNPMVIVAAAVTVTLHHAIIWMVIPSSMFNYDASFWVVGVHAAFVVVESVAAIFIARNYFDNVIGLEKIVAERTGALAVANRSMGLVLRHVNEGLLTVDREGTMADERSSRVDQWLGAPPDSMQLQDYVTKVDPQAGTWLELGWSDLLDGFMPIEVTLSQFPKRIQRDGRDLALQYIPIGGEEDDFDRLLVVISDVTADMAREAADAERAQVLTMLDQYLTDRSGFLDFFQDSEKLLEALAERRYESREECLRWLHTLKGNSLSYGLGCFGDRLHDLETSLNEEGREPLDRDFAQLNAAWAGISQNLEQLTKGASKVNLDVEPEVYEEILESLNEDIPSHRPALQLLHRIPLDSVEQRLERIAMQARRIAERVDDMEVEVVIEAEKLFLDPKRWAPFWSSFVHIIRNSLDHGLESLEEREAAGKQGPGTLSVRAYEANGAIQIEVHDDGRGIDWAKVATRAQAANAPFTTQEDLVEALFMDGLSTRETATALSGRGFGMSAVRHATQELGGVVEVTSEIGAGTTLKFSFPTNSLRMAV